MTTPRDQCFRWVVGSLLAGGAAAIAVAGLTRWGARRWAASTKALQRELDSARIPPMNARYSEDELAGLPVPVQRYFRTALQAGQPMVVAASITQAGSFRMRLDVDRWQPFTACQQVVTGRPGFVWNARIAMLPGLTVRVVDAYVNGSGRLRAAVAGLFTVAQLRGDGAIAQGELMRYLAEAAWYPTALLPSQGVRWKAVDEHAAKATLADGGLGVTLLFNFNADGTMASVRASARARMVGKDMLLTPWEGRWSNHQVRDGMLVPLTGEVAWLLPEGRMPYWRGSISSMAHDFAHEAPKPTLDPTSESDE